MYWGKAWWSTIKLLVYASFSMMSCRLMMSNLLRVCQWYSHSNLPNAEVGNIQFLCLRASFQVLRWHSRLSRSAPATGSPRKPVTVTTRIIAFLMPLATGILEKWGWCLEKWLVFFLDVKISYVSKKSLWNWCLQQVPWEQETFEQSDVHFTIRSCRFSMIFSETANKLKNQIPKKYVGEKKKQHLKDLLANQPVQSLP